MARTSPDLTDAVREIETLGVEGLLESIEQLGGSVKVCYRFPARLKVLAQAKAAAEHRSMTDVLIAGLEAYVGVKPSASYAAGL